MQRLIRHNILPQEFYHQILVNIHSFLYLFNHYLFTEDICLNNTWSILARNSKFGLRIFKILLVFIMIRCGRMQSTGQHWFQRDRLRGGERYNIIFLLYTTFISMRRYHFTISQILSIKSLKYNVMFLNNFESSHFSRSLYLHNHPQLL